MKIGQKLYTIYGYITIISQRYSALQNKVVFIGVDEQGMEHEIDDSMVRQSPQSSSSESVDLMAIGKAFNLKKGDKVITSGGLYGTITGITDDSVTIEIAEKVRVKVLKSAVVDKAKGE